MLTGDENIVDIDFVVFWRINDAAKYLFNIQNPDTTVKEVAESAMREVVGKSVERLLHLLIVTGARRAPLPDRGEKGAAEGVGRE